MPQQSRIPQDGELTSHRLDRDLLAVPKRLIQFPDGQRSLQPYLAQYAFFTPGPAYLWGQFRDTVLADFLSRQPRPVEFSVALFSRPLFRGLETRDGDRAWNHSLWAIERDFWQDFVDQCCAAVMVDHQDRGVFRFALQELQLPDPLHCERAIIETATQPLIPVGVVAVRSNRYTAAFDAAEPPRLQFFAADRDTRRYADALFTQDPVTALLAQDKPQ